MALSSKPSAAILPALLALCAWCILPRARLRAALFATLPAIGVVAAFVGVYVAMPQPPQSTILAGTVSSSALGAVTVTGACISGC